MALWTIRTALEWTSGYLGRKGDEHPRLSAEWLMCAATGFSRVELYTNYDRPLDKDELSVLHAGVERRGKGEPLQYVTGEMPFRHIVLKCAKGVLIPRPETEVLVDHVLAYIDSLSSGGEGDAGPLVLEVGTGTGCVALSIAQERPAARVRATDVSPQAIELAQRNRSALGLDDRVELYLADIAAGVPDVGQPSYDVVVSNPPYIPTAEIQRLPREVGGYEPLLALDGGPDGLDVFRRVAACASTSLRAGGLLACELHEDRLRDAAALTEASGSFKDVRVEKDLPGRDRVLLATRA